MADNIIVIVAKAIMLSAAWKRRFHVSTAVLINWSDAFIFYMNK